MKFGLMETCATRWFSLTDLPLRTYTRCQREKFVEDHWRMELYIRRKIFLFAICKGTISESTGIDYTSDEYPSGKKLAPGLKRDSGMALGYINF